MNPIEKVIHYIQNLNKKDFIKYAYICFAILILVSGFILYRYFSNITALKKDLKKINNFRQEAQVILSKNIQVQKQKANVEEIIEKGKNFKLLQYFDSTMEKIGIRNIKEKEISTSDLENLKAQGYTEVKLTSSISGTNMKQIVELLDEFEKNERIYTKSLEITRSADNKSVDVNIVIATIQPKSEVTEITE